MSLKVLYVGQPATTRAAAFCAFLERTGSSVELLVTVHACDEHVCLAPATFSLTTVAGR